MRSNNVLMADLIQYRKAPTLFQDFLGVDPEAQPPTEIANDKSFYGINKT